MIAAHLAVVVSLLRTDGGADRFQGNRPRLLVAIDICHHVVHYRGKHFLKQ